MLQPLLIPQKVWFKISMDFIKRFPKFTRKDTIFTVVDRLIKYAQFIALTFPFIAITIA